MSTLLDTKKITFLRVLAICYTHICLRYDWTEWLINLLQEILKIRKNFLNHELDFYNEPM